VATVVSVDTLVIPVSLDTAETVVLVATPASLASLVPRDTQASVELAVTPVSLAFLDTVASLVRADIQDLAESLDSQE